MKLLILSDSHGNIRSIRRILEKEAPFDYLIHCGDGVRDLLHAEMPAGSRVLKVAGNVDLSVVYDMDRVITEEICGLHFLITHGDLYDAHNGYGMLMSEGRNTDSDVVLFGHTHIQYCSEGTPVLFNPGTAMKGFYGVIHCEAGEDPVFTHGKIQS